MGNIYTLDELGWRFKIHPQTATLYLIRTEGSDQTTLHALNFAGDRVEIKIPAEVKLVYSLLFRFPGGFTIEDVKREGLKSVTPKVVFSFYNKQRIAEVVDPFMSSDGDRLAIVLNELGSAVTEDYPNKKWKLFLEVYRDLIKSPW